MIVTEKSYEQNTVIQKWLPDELAFNVFSYLRFPHVLGERRVSKEWHRILDDSRFLKDGVFRDVAFGTKQALLNSDISDAEKVQIEKEYVLLSDKVVRYLLKPCQIFQEKRRIHTHILICVKQGMSIEKFAKCMSYHNESGIVSAFDVRSEIQTSLYTNEYMGNTSWKLLLRYPLQKSFNKNYEQQMKLIFQLNVINKMTYRIPRTTEVLLGIYAQAIKGEKLFHNMFIRTKETVQEVGGGRYTLVYPNRVVVGGYQPRKWQISSESDQDQAPDLGVTAVLDAERIDTD